MADEENVARGIFVLPNEVSLLVKSIHVVLTTNTDPLVHLQPVPYAVPPALHVNMPAVSLTHPPCDPTSSADSCYTQRVYHVP